MAPPLPFFLFLALFVFRSAAQPVVPNSCGERCGSLPIPFPFYVNDSCGPSLPALRLSCSAPDYDLRLSLSPLSALRVLAFLPSGSLLLDYSSPSTLSCDRWYADVNRSFGLDSTPFFAVTADNLLRLYDCEDSSICRAGCERIGASRGCDANLTDFGCCYPLSDGSVWKVGSGFSVFGEFGCRGFSSWAVVRSASGNGTATAQRGIEVEWAVPKGHANGTECADGAVVVNATAVRGGFRCVCAPGFTGDGFAGGTGCLKSCSSDPQDENDVGCCKGRFCRKRVVILSGVLLSVLVLLAIIVLCFFLRKLLKENMSDLDPSFLPNIIGKACNTRRFTYKELNEATRGFENDRNLVDVIDGTVHLGRLGDGTNVAVQKFKCQNQKSLRKVLHKAEILSHCSHRNIARIIGFCFDSAETLLVVHEHFSNGTLEEHLRRERGIGLSWYLRMNIASEIASALAYLQYEISIPSYIEDLKTSDILIDTYYSAKVTGFEFLKSGLVNGSCSYVVSHDTYAIYSLGLILLELIMGSKPGNLSDTILPKIESNKFHEIVDPYLRFHEQPPLHREQIEKAVGLVVQCLSSKENGGPCMVDVVKDLKFIMQDNMCSSSRIEPKLEVTFSNSSLLQMVSMSPDNMHASFVQNAN
ncbi:probably inactive receptor-like protein kinase At2g46850 [Curcuma longa]|uniref:probably inactive receptor-like protein kinase At2g46850 n=1 Tax=Curcuma longa TaxID=136217 RepID=UPI003D9EFE7F